MDNLLVTILLTITAIIVIAGATVVFVYPFANLLKFTRNFYCKIGWHCHMKDYQPDYFDGASIHCTCKWCGYKGMVDSQGNLF